MDVLACSAGTIETREKTALILDGLRRAERSE
jgi:hypothetical protein